MKGNEKEKLNWELELENQYFVVVEKSIALQELDLKQEEVHL